MSNCSETDNDMISPKEAARLLRTSRFTILRMCDRGKFPGAHQLTGAGGHWRIPRSSVEAVLAATRPRKRVANG